MEDEFDPDVDFEDDEPSPFSKTKKHPLWLVVGAFFELIGNILRSFAGFLEVLQDISLQRFTEQNDRERFIMQASHEIEMLTSGVYDATGTESGGSVGSGTTE